MTGTAPAASAWRRVRESWFTYAMLWLLSRAFLGHDFVTRVSYIVGDVGYYHRQLLVSDIGRVLVEYPTPVVWSLQLVKVVVGHDLAQFVLGFVVTMLLLDAFMASLLWRRGGPHRAEAVLAWIVFILLIGPLAYFRFDLAPALLAGAAALYANRRPALAGALVAVGASLKLWPALLVLPLLGRGRERVRSGLGFLVTGVGLALASLVVAGWSRTVSPLAWQSDRGLQIESVPATALMWLRTLDASAPLQVAMSRYNAYEVTGPGAAQAIVASDVATVVGLLVIAWLGWRAIRLPERSVVTVAAVMLAIILIMIVTNKTLSPQYLIWLGGPLCAMIAGADGPDDAEPDRPSAQPLWGPPLLLTVAGCLLAAATQLVYPTLYGELITGRGTALATSVLVLRNVGLVAFTVAATGYAVRCTRPARPAAEAGRPTG